MMLIVCAVIATKAINEVDVQSFINLVTAASLMMNLHISGKISDLKVYIHENFVRKGAK